MSDRQSTPTIAQTSTEPSTAGLHSPPPENQRRGNRRGRRGRRGRGRGRRGRSDRQTRSQSIPESQLTSEHSTITTATNDRLAEAYAYVKETLTEYREGVRHEILLDMCRRIQQLQGSLTEARRRITELEGYIDSRFHSDTRTMLLDILNGVQTSNLLLNPTLVIEPSPSDAHLPYSSPKNQPVDMEGDSFVSDDVSADETELAPSGTEDEDETTYQKVHNEEEIGSNKSDEQRISQVDIPISGCSDPHSDEPAITQNQSNEPSLIEEDDNDSDETTTVFKRPRTS